MFHLLRAYYTFPESYIETVPTYLAGWLDREKIETPRRRNVFTDVGFPTTRTVTIFRASQDTWDISHTCTGNVQEYSGIYDIFHSNIVSIQIFTIMTPIKTNPIDL